MEKQTIKILLIEDDPEDTTIISEMLQDIKDTRYELTLADRLATALKYLAQDKYEIILLDLDLPDSQGLSTLAAVESKVIDTPIVVLTYLNDDEMGVKAVKSGAQDYLIKSQVTSQLLSRSIRYAIERQRMMEMLRSMALLDDLTGLYNRRGLMTLGKQHITLTRRLNKGFTLLFADLDEMKWINDTFGHKVGDQALKDVALILKETFRESDILARQGGDEFVVITAEAGPETAEKIIQRLQRKTEEFKVRENRPYPLNLSIGYAYYDPQKPVSLYELLEKADKGMYENKQKKVYGY